MKELFKGREFHHYLTQLIISFLIPLLYALYFWFLPSPFIIEYNSNFWNGSSNDFYNLFWIILILVDLFLIISAVIHITLLIINKDKYVIVPATFVSPEKFLFRNFFYCTAVIDGVEFLFVVRNFLKACPTTKPGYYHSQIRIAYLPHKLNPKNEVSAILINYEPKTEEPPF